MDMSTTFLLIIDTSNIINITKYLMEKYDVK